MPPYIHIQVISIWPKSQKNYFIQQKQINFLSVFCSVLSLCKSKLAFVLCCILWLSLSRSSFHCLFPSCTIVATGHWYLATNCKSLSLSLSLCLTLSYSLWCLLPMQIIVPLWKPNFKLNPQSWQAKVISWNWISNFRFYSISCDQIP